MTTSDADANRRILIVDDNPAIHDDFRKVLAKRTASPTISALEAELFGPAAGAVPTEFVLESAFQGADAVERVKQARLAGRPYALAFVDVRMPPGLDGIETTEQIWRVDPAVQIVLCTAYSDYSWSDMRTRLGPSDRLLILKKPFDNVEVLQLATALTEKWSLSQQVKRQVVQLEETVRQQTDELRHSEQHYRLITENAGDLIGLMDGDTRVVYRSPSYERLLGYSAAELAALGAFGWAEPTEREALLTAARACFSDGTSRVLQFNARRKDGSLVALESVCTPFRDATGRITGVLWVARDMTERRQLELQLRHAQRLESIGQLAAGVAHEVNTPTQFIADNTHFLVDAWTRVGHVLENYRALATAAAAHPEFAGLAKAAAAAESAEDVPFLEVEIPRALQQSLDGLSRVSRIVCALKEFAHPGAPQLTPSDLNRIVERALVVTRYEWKYVAEAVTALDDTLPPVPCVVDELNQVLLNLIINAAHAIGDALKPRQEARGTITIRTRRDGAWAVIEVEDTGTGISPEIRDRIFEPFFTTKPVGKGSGQGLALAHASIVKHHHGRIDVESEVGRGSTFILRLPLEAPAEPAS
jgi:PAS domain S-box-containing protein